jgi:hypothetical protein
MFSSGDLIGIIGIVATIVSTWIAIRQHNKRNKAVIAARETIQRVNGTLIGIKPAVRSLPDVGTGNAARQAADDVVKAIDDGLSAINQQNSKLDAL